MRRRGVLQPPSLAPLACIATLIKTLHTTAWGPVAPLELAIEVEREEDGRWLAEVPAFPGTMCYGLTRSEAVAHVQALALRVLAERLEHTEAPADALTIAFHAA